MNKINGLKIRARDLRIFLFTEVLTVPVVILIFKFIEPKSHAGIVAGLFFVLIGALLVLRNFSWVNYKKSPVFWLSCVHLFLIALPMLVFRFMNLDIPFEEVRILGLEGPVLHKISENVFMCLIVSTFGELTYVRYQQNKLAE